MSEEQDEVQDLENSACKKDGIDNSVKWKYLNDERKYKIYMCILYEACYKNSLFSFRVYYCFCNGLLLF